MLNDAIRIGCRFSLPPNSLGYCGQDSAPEKFKRCVISGDCKGVKEEFEKFIVLNPYLETLAGITGKSKFSRPVIEAYWFGNEELKKAKISDYQILLDNFSRQGVPPWLVDELRLKVPHTFIPHHLFQVLHVGVGKASGSVPYNIETINNCMIRWGEVVSVDGNSITVSVNYLDKAGSSYTLNKRNEKAEFLQGFLPGIGRGNVVAVHWHQAVKKLTPRETGNLLYWTQRVLDSLTES